MSDLPSANVPAPTILAEIVLVPLEDEEVLKVNYLGPPATTISLAF
jgi:hypothetical protein